MPNLPYKQCGWPGCRKLSRNNYCEDHLELHNKEVFDNSWSGRGHKNLGYKWDVLSRRIRRNEPVCRMCKIRAATEVDHITPRSKGGTDDESNLQPLCHSCHEEKTRRDRKKK